MAQKKNNVISLFWKNGINYYYYCHHLIKLIIFKNLITFIHLFLFIIAYFQRYILKEILYQTQIHLLDYIIIWLIRCKKFYFLLWLQTHLSYIGKEILRNTGTEFIFISRLILILNQFLFHWYPCWEIEKVYK